MSRWEFMRQLEELLYDIAPAEREEALQYYNDYFNDAGAENEQEVIAALGTPEQVAEIVKDGLNGVSQGEFTEQGFKSGTTLQNEVIKSVVQESDSDSQKQNGFVNGQKETRNSFGSERKDNDEGVDADKKKSGLPTWAIVLIVSACIIFSPVIIGVLVAVLGALLGLICSVLGLILGIGCAMLILYIAAIMLIVVGMGSVFASPLIGAGLIGAALICAAVGILLMVLLVFLVGKCIPFICKGVSNLWKKIFNKKRGAQA